MSALLQIENLQVTFNTRHGQVTALDSVSRSVNAGETLGVVGESGCGKSITALSVMGLIPMPPGRIAGGSIRLNGEELVGASDARLRGLRGSEVAGFACYLLFVESQDHSFDGRSFMSRLTVTGEFSTVPTPTV